MLITQRIDLSAIHCRMIILINLVGWEVRNVDVGIEARFKRCADRAELIPDDAMKEWVFSDVGASELAAR